MRIGFTENLFERTRKSCYGIIYYYYYCYCYYYYYYNTSDFYEPYNLLLSKILNDDKFSWINTNDLSLREQQQKEVTHTVVNDHISTEQRKMEIIKQRSLQRRHDTMLNHKFGGEEFGALGDPENQHGIARHGNDSTFISNENFVRKERDRVRFLRGQENSDVDLHFQLLFKPRKLAIDDLPRAKAFNAWFAESPLIASDKNGINGKDDAAQQLCSAAFGLDLYALEHLLYNIGNNDNINNNNNNK